MTLAYLLLGVSALMVILAGFHVYRTNVRLQAIRDLLVEIRDDLRH